MTKSVKRRVRLIAILGIAALVFTACGDDDSTSSSTSTPEPTATAAATDGGSTAEPTPTEAMVEKSPVLIVGTFDVSGPSKSGQHVMDAAQAIVDDINANGGLNGHQIETDFRDTGGDAAKAVSITTEMIAKNPILFLSVSEGTLLAQADVFKTMELPLMGVGYNPAVWGGKIPAFGIECSTDGSTPIPCTMANAFTVTTTTSAVVDEQLYGAKAAGATKAVAAVCAEVEACSGAIPIFEASATALGLEHGTTVKVSSAGGDYTSECIGFIQEGDDFVQLSGSAAMGQGIIDSCLDQGYTGTFGASAGSVHGDLLKNDNIVLAGGLNAFPWWVDDPAVQAYRDVMNNAGIPEDDGWADPTFTGLYSVLHIFVKAQANLSDDPTGAEALENMYTIQNETLGGLTPPLTWTKDNPDRSVNCFWPFILDNGELTAPAGGLTVQCNDQ